MAKVNVLALAMQQQQSPELCGPAAMRMVLSAFGILPSQSSLWTDVQNNSGGTIPVNGSLPTLEFQKQVCHLCGAWFCWFTSPEAMARTLTAAGPYAASAKALFPASNDDGITHQIDSLERAVPYAATTIVRGANHWVVVAGYHLEDTDYPGGPPVLVGNRLVNGVYWADPADAAPAVNFIATATWRRILKSVDCGPHTNTFPTIVGTDPVTVVIKWWLHVVMWLKRWLPPWPPWAKAARPTAGG